MARKEKKEEPKKGAPEWMTTYSDMVTLLLCFFVLLFAMSTIDSAKWRAILEAFTGAPSVFTDPASIIIEHGDMSDSETGEDKDDVAELADSEAFERLYQELADLAESLGGEASMEITRTEYEILIRFTDDSVLFDSGRADLKPGAEEIIDAVMSYVVEFIDGTLKTIRIEGHTDNLPISTPQFPNNWWLSTTRAGNILMYILRGYPDINPAFFSSQGRGEYHPIGDNSTAEGRAKNRRVEFIIVKSDQTGPEEIPR